MRVGGRKMGGCKYRPLWQFAFMIAIKLRAHKQQCEHFKQASLPCLATRLHSAHSFLLHCQFISFVKLHFPILICNYAWPFYHFICVISFLAFSFFSSALVLSMFAEGWVCVCVYIYFVLFISSFGVSFSDTSTHFTCHNYNFISFSRDITYMHHLCCHRSTDCFFVPPVQY